MNQLPEAANEQPTPPAPEQVLPEPTPKSTPAIPFMPNTWGEISSPIAIAMLLVNNLVPLLGVLYWGWELYSVILIYWLENGVIGFFNVIKMAMARGIPPNTQKDAAFRQLIGEQHMPLVQKGAQLALIPLFIMNYGIFWVVHGVFVQVLFGSTFGFFRAESLSLTSITDGFSLEHLLPTGVLGAVGAMFISHGTSFVRNYIGRGEYLVATPQQVMSQPYNRVIILHLTIIGGAFLISQLREPLYGLILLIGLKTVVDLWTHLREHKRFRAWTT